MNIAIIGYGGMGEYHYKRIKDNAIMTVKGIYDIDNKRCELAEKEGLEVYKTYQDIAEDKNIDGVLIATPNDFHFEYIKYFALNGKKVLCEKPVVRNSLEFKNLLKITKDNVVAVNQNRRFDKDFIIVKNIIKSGILGGVYKIESKVLGANGVPGGWRKNLNQGGGMMLDWGVHLIDQMCCLFKKFTALRCVYSYALGFDVEDGFILDLFSESGEMITIEVQTNDFIGSDRWRIFGRNGSAVIKNWELEGNIILPVYNKEKELVSIQAGNGLTKTMAYQGHDSVKALPLPEVIVNSEEIYENFSKVENNNDLTVKHEEVMRVLQIMDKCKDSAKNGGALIKINI